MFKMFLTIAFLLSSTLDKNLCAFADSSSDKINTQSEITTSHVSDSSVEPNAPQNNKNTGTDGAIQVDRLNELNTAANTTPNSQSTAPNNPAQSAVPIQSENTINNPAQSVAPAQSENTVNNPAPLRDNPPSKIVKDSLQEKLKKELDEIEKHRAVAMTLELQVMEMAVPLTTLQTACDKLRGVPFIACSAPWIALAQMYYLQSFSNGNCKNAINMSEWVLRSSQPYQTKAFGARAAMLEELLFLADLYQRTKDAAKAEYYCKQFFSIRSDALVDINNLKVLNKDRGPDPHREALVKSIMPGVKQLVAEHKSETFHIGSTTALIYLVLAHVNYDKGDYAKSSEYLSKAKAEGLGFGKLNSPVHSTKTSKTNMPNKVAITKTKNQ